MSKFATDISFFICMIAFLMLMSCGAQKYDWRTMYKDQKNHAYGTYIIKRYLDNISPDQQKEITQKLSKYFEEGSQVKGNYFFMGDAMLVDESDAEALAKFVSKGNNAFISTKIFPNSISAKIFTPCHVETNEDDEQDYSGDDSYTYEDDDFVVDTIPVLEKMDWEYQDFEHLDFNVFGGEVGRLKLDLGLNLLIETDSLYTTIKNGKPRYHDWYYLHDSLACIDSNNLEVLGYLNDTLINYFKIPHGEGSFFIHTNPLVFTNIHMLNDKTSEYVELITEAKPTKDWHWDDYSRTSRDMGKSRNQNNSYLESKGPLTYILKQDSLRWAWYSLLAMGGFFLMFRAKRKQRIVPVLEKKENTSLTFINTIGNLYFNKNDRKQLCEDQMQLWLEDIRHHYRINTSDLGDDFVGLLSAKTKRPKEEIQGLLDYYHNIENSDFVSENTMVTFYQKLNKFSIQSKS